MMRNEMPPVRVNRGQSLVVFGEFFFDLVFYRLPRIPRMGEEVRAERFASVPGGGLATTALVAARLGTPTSVVTRVGWDAKQNPAWQSLVESGISVKCCEFDSERSTALTVCAAFDHDRMMITHDPINRRLETLLARGRVQRKIHAAKHFHLACAMWPPRIWSAALRRLRRPGLTLSADIGWNPDVWEFPGLPSLLSQFDFVFPNEPEALAMTREKTVEKAARKLARWVRVPVIKLGEAGSLAVSNSEILRVRSLRLPTVDATGAGDAFNGGFLHGSLTGWPLDECLRAGNVCGALAVTRAGGSSAMPSPRKLRRLMIELG